MRRRIYVDRGALLANERAGNMDKPPITVEREFEGGILTGYEFGVQLEIDGVIVGQLVYDPLMIGAPRSVWLNVMPGVTIRAHDGSVIE